jgi:hypothetical protein
MSAQKFSVLNVADVSPHYAAEDWDAHCDEDSDAGAGCSSDEDGAVVAKPSKPRGGKRAADGKTVEPQHKAGGGGGGAAASASSPAAASKPRSVGALSDDEEYAAAVAAGGSDDEEWAVIE